MRSLDDLAEAATAAEARLQVNQSALARVVLQSGDDLFQTPLIALATLIVAREGRSGISTHDVTTLALATLLRHAQVERGTRDRIQWSAPLRRRCADALAFLETAKLIHIQDLADRMVFISSDGRAFLRKLFGAIDEAGVLARSLDRSCTVVRQGGPALL